LTPIERWYRILNEALKKFLRGRKLISAIGSCEFMVEKGWREFRSMPPDF
jgi:hypothetical protein